MVGRPESVTVVGAGVLGLWQALSCARAGFQVRLVDQDDTAFGSSASVLAGGMLAPDCEAFSAPDLVRDQGRLGVLAWRELFPGVIGRGSLVVAGGRDASELDRFSKLTTAFEEVDGPKLKELEPGLSGRFSKGLLFGDEAHFDVHDALGFLLAEVRRLGVDVCLGFEFSCRDVEQVGEYGVVIDCRGLAARDEPFPGLEGIVSRLRGVRGERMVISSKDVRLRRPVRLLHPRHPIYVVPGDDGRFVVGATVIESDDNSAASVRSVLELLGSAFALHPAFGEAEVLDVKAGVRPAFADNIPRAVVADGGRVICVNGAYRHGFLLAPMLAEGVGAHLCGEGGDHPLLLADDAYA